MVCVGSFALTCLPLLRIQKYGLHLTGIDTLHHVAVQMFPFLLPQQILKGREGGGRAVGWPGMGGERG